jgi:hypothetical protein
LKLAEFAEPKPMAFDKQSGTAIAVAVTPDDLRWNSFGQLNATDIGIRRISTAACVESVVMEKRSVPMGSDRLARSATGVFPQ